MLLEHRLEHRRRRRARLDQRRAARRAASANACDRRRASGSRGRAPRRRARSASPNEMPLALGAAPRRSASARSPMPRLGTLRIRRRRHRVGRVGEHPQVGQRVADLAALVEAHAADDLVGQPDPDEHLLEHPRLRVGPVEDRDVARARRPRRRCSRSISLRDERRLVVLVVGDVADDRLAVARRRTTGSSACGSGCGRSPRWRRTGSSGWSGSSARAGSSSRRGSPARTRGCCGSSRRGRRRSTGRRRRRRTARPAARSPAGRRRPARGPARTARGWCPGTRRPARAGTGAGSARRRRGRPAAG